LGAVLFIATLCFLDNPRAALREAVRVLSPGGAILVADIIADSAWGRFYLERKNSGHPFYADATFYTLAELTRLLEDVRLRVTASTSTLLQERAATKIEIEEPVRGIAPGASFVCLLARAY
jgi:ubiquinone/menaquinone biosynthesis C-methylase UbiE